ncbi:Nuc-1 negative regulatory preg [Lecanosticta acicola]|uniref:Nuc-1 negative regulatory preg n=1 Tax=Lecanosticta acicola TaxID=111012 RepID=A0AAI9E9S6_9PEZI|nr:Nuc-1 negative regulatory preg [Lecanosticta acicola]
MSATVSSSSSPVNSPPPHSFHRSSPRSTFGTAQRSPAAPRASPRLSTTYSAHSPRRALASGSTGPSYPRPPAGESAFPVAGAGIFQGYTSRGTQYSPDGLPPTADATKVAAHARKTAAAAGSARKRKEAAHSDESSEQQMSGADSAASGASHWQLQQQQQQQQQTSTAASRPQHPPEAQPRGDPARASAATGSADPEPQEARSTHGHFAAPKRSKQGSLQVMSSKYENCNPKDLGVCIANMLMELIRINDRIPLRDGRLTRFHSRAPPGIGVTDYLQRLIQHATLSPPILLSMVYYIDRLCTMYPAFTINSLTVHRFLITAATVAAKGLSDSFWTNPTYARIGGIPVSELATLELELLQRVQWKIVPKPEALEEYYASLVERTDGYILEGYSSSGSSSISLDESDVVTKAGEEKMDEQQGDEEMENGPT